MTTNTDPPECPVCEGEGEYRGQECDRCKGSGVQA